MSETKYGGICLTCEKEQYMCECKKLDVTIPNNTPNRGGCPYDKDCYLPAEIEKSKSDNIFLFNEKAIVDFQLNQLKEESGQLLVRAEKAEAEVSQLTRMYDHATSEISVQFQHYAEAAAQVEHLEAEVDRLAKENAFARGIGESKCVEKQLERIKELEAEIALLKKKLVEMESFGCFTEDASGYRCGIVDRAEKAEKQVSGYEELIRNAIVGYENVINCSCDVEVIDMSRTSQRTLEDALRHKGGNKEVKP